MAPVCSACGISLPDDARFCSHCGTPQGKVGAPGSRGTRTEPLRASDHPTDILRETDQGVLAVWEMAADAMALSDPDGIMVLANAAYYDVFGYRPDEVIGHDFALIFPEDQRAAAMAAYRAVFRSTTVAPAFETAIRRKDGTVRVVESRITFLTQQGQRVLMLNIIRDITYRKRAEQAVQRERDVLSQIVEILPSGLVVAGPTGELQLTNDAAREMIGQDPTGWRVLAGDDGRFRLEHPDGTPYVTEDLPLVRSLTRGETVRGEQITLRHVPTSREIPLLVNAAPLRDTAGQIVGAILALQDISALRSAERLQDDWVSVIAQDLRQPLTIILGSITLVQEMLQSHSDFVREMQQLEQARIAARHQSTMIRDLIDSLRIERRMMIPERHLVDVPSVVRERLKALGTFPGNHVVEVEVRGETAFLALDPSLVGQVLENLLTNAATLSPVGSPIRVTIDQQSSEVELIVTNQGKGIAPSDIAKLFTRFHRIGQRPPAPTGGLGLGLFIAKGLVEVHGGHIWVESIPGETTSFHVSLPRPTD